MPPPIPHNPILVDTDVLVDFLRGHRKAVIFVKTHSSRMLLSSIVVAELYAGVRGEVEFAALEGFVSLFQIVPVTTKIAKSGGLYKREFHKSHGVGLADALLAATAESEKAELTTLNTKHYPMFKGLRSAYRK